MNTLDVVVIWAGSVQHLLSSMGVTINCGRSTDDRLNASCWVNLRRDSIEAELLVWESGEAELAIIDINGSNAEEHLDGIDAGNLSHLLARLLAAFE